MKKSFWWFRCGCICIKQMSGQLKYFLRTGMSVFMLSNSLVCNFYFFLSVTLVSCADLLQIFFPLKLIKCLTRVFSKIHNVKRSFNWSFWFFDIFVCQHPITFHFCTHYYIQIGNSIFPIICTPRRDAWGQPVIIFSSSCLFSIVPAFKYQHQNSFLRQQNTGVKSWSLYLVTLIP